MSDCPWCGEPLRPSEGGGGPDGVCANGHEWWNEGQQEGK